MTQAPTRAPLTYADAGVKIEEGYRLVEQIGPAVRATARPGARPELGGFGGLFDLGATAYQDPLLVAATDGVGTKLLLGIELDRLEGLGQDLVAMCVNDLVVQGAEPLFFLDYFATGALDADQAARVVLGIAQACTLAGCALIGGETAEMPGFYAPGHFDLAGFAVGAVERSETLPRKAAMQAGDALIALPSNGLHANGFSLVRKLIERRSASLNALPPFDAPEATLGEVLLRPTELYVDTLLKLHRDPEIGLKGAAHITGGGWVENMPRALPAGLSPQRTPNNPPPDPLFTWLAGKGEIRAEDMIGTFNCGIGMLLVVAPESVEPLLASIPGAWLWGELADSSTPDWGPIDTLFA